MDSSEEAVGTQSGSRETYFKVAAFVLSGLGSDGASQRAAPDKRTRSQPFSLSAPSARTRSVPGPHLTRSISPSRELTVSGPAPARIESSPVPPTRRSRLLPPLSWSLPESPRRRSRPLLPKTQSSPPSPVARSAPRRPRRRSPASVPTRASRPAGPVLGVRAGPEAGAQVELLDLAAVDLDLLGVEHAPALLAGERVALHLRRLERRRRRVGDLDLVVVSAVAAKLFTRSTYFLPAGRRGVP